MTRAQLEHLIRAAAVLADDDELIVLGSQSILGPYADAPSALRVSVGADLYPNKQRERTELIDRTIGEGSLFHATYGYYARGVASTTAILPEGWENRLIPICNENTRWATGLCLDLNDLLLAKYAAGRETDHHFTRAAIVSGLADPEVLKERLVTMPLDSARHELIAKRIAADVASGG